MAPSPPPLAPGAGDSAEAPQLRLRSTGLGPQRRSRPSPRESSGEGCRLGPPRSTAPRRTAPSQPSPSGSQARCKQLPLQRSETSNQLIPELPWIQIRVTCAPLRDQCLDLAKRSSRKFALLYLLLVPISLCDLATENQDRRVSHHAGLKDCLPIKVIPRRRNASRKK